MMAELSVDPLVADLLTRIATNLREEFSAQIERLEFDADFPNRIAICIGLLNVVQCALAKAD
jgi:hypothetical protein